MKNPASAEFERMNSLRVMALSMIAALTSVTRQYSKAKEISRWPL
jgi:hypothetical protein